MGSGFRIMDDGKLVSQETWENGIRSLTTPFDELETNNERAKRLIASCLVESVKEAGKEAAGKKTAILLSGGVDSSLLSHLAQKHGNDFCCYTVGLENSEDVKWAAQFAKMGKIGLRSHILSLDELEQAILKVMSITKRSDIVTVGVGVVTYVSGCMAKQDGRASMMTGLGSEELFAGYERHAKALEQGLEAVHRECVAGLIAMRERDVVRDLAIAKHLGLGLMLPFLDGWLVKAALGIHPMHKISTEEKKIVLREAAVMLGLPKEFALRKKKAAQYGSGVIDGIEKLAKRKSFQSKKEYLEHLAGKAGI